jgi:DNA topoisomerase-2
LKSWTQNYKEQLETWITGTEKQPAFIKDYKEYHTDSKVHFVITLTEENMKKAVKEGLEHKFKMTTSISTSNLVCHDLEGRIKKYTNVTEILSDFYALRSKFYIKRKDYLLNLLTQDHMKIENRVRFVTEIIKEELKVHNRKKLELLQELKQKHYDPIFKDDNLESSNGGYDYLLSMPIWNLTWEKVQALINEKTQKEAEIKLLLKETPTSLWKTDLEKFKNEWEKFEYELGVLEAQTADNKTVAGKKGKKRVAALDDMIKKKKKKVDQSDSDSEDGYAPIFKKQVKAVKPKEVKEVKSVKVEVVKDVKPVKGEIKAKKAAAKPKIMEIDTDEETDSEAGVSFDSDVMDDEDEEVVPKKGKKAARRVSSDLDSEEEVVVDKPKSKRAVKVSSAVVSEEESIKPKKRATKVYSVVVSDEVSKPTKQIIKEVKKEVKKEIKKPVSRKPKAGPKDVFDIESDEPTPKKLKKSQKTIDLSSDDQPKLKQSKINFPKVLKRPTPEKPDTSNKKRILGGKKIAVPGVKVLAPVQISDSDDATVDDRKVDERDQSEEEVVKPRRALKAKKNYRVSDVSLGAEESFVMSEESEEDFEMSASD